MRSRSKRWSVITAMAVVAGLAIVSGCSNELMDIDVGESEPETQEEPETYTVTFDRQGGSGGSTSVTVTVGEPMPEAVAPAKGSAVFGGYYLRHYSARDGIGEQYYTAEMGSARDWDISSDVELVAHWVLQIGDEGPAGGIVFYDKGEYSDGWRYLEAWTADEDGTYQWKTELTSTPETSTALGSGYENTYSAMTGTEHPAAEVVRNATHGGYEDWFLPSQDELNEMYENLHEEGLGDFASALYWSSSEASADAAWRQHFVDGGQPDSFKSGAGRVRAVRAF